ncbi:MAG: DUF6263 family protein [Sedimentisphaerales bacterium]|jgi:hypothetical protein
MKSTRVCYLAASFAIGLLLIGGCARQTRKTQQVPTAPAQPAQEEPAVDLVLKFTPGNSTTYRVARESDRGVEWEGSAETKPKGFTGGHTGNRMEMTFTQRINSVDNKGTAAAKITITALKYLIRVKNKVTLDFDSSRQQDVNSPLSELIGQSYTVELTPNGGVAKVIDASEARAAVKGATTADKIAANLLTNDAIKNRHTISALPGADDEPVHVGQTWSKVENFAFDLMGAKSYEKRYTLEEVRDVRDHRIAVVKMNAVPSAAKAKELYKEQGTSPFAQMFDSTETLTGELTMDLTAGKVNECHEQLLIEWFIVDTNAKSNVRPGALRMSAARLAGIERVD